MKKIFKIEGMTCNSCASRIEEGLKDLVKGVHVNFAEEKAEVYFDEDKVSEEEIIKKIEEIGYGVRMGEESKGSEEKETKESVFNENNIGWIVMIGSSILLIVILYYYLSNLGYNIEIPNAGESTGLFLLFLAGILTGFHCVSMCGGFVVSYTTKNAIKGHKGFSQHLVYGGSKVLSYALIGGLFGLIGGVIAFSVGLRAWISILAGVFMIFYALSMFGFKWFRRFQFNPKFLTKAAGSASKHAQGFYKAPLITGLLSGLFIACGPLQAMYLYAMGSGSFFSGFFGLAVFGLGTLPVMIGFGSMATVISHKATKRILKVSAIIVLILGLIMLNRGLVVMGSDYSYDAIKAKVVGVGGVTGNVILKEGYQIIEMEVDRYGWSPDSFALKKGVPTKWNINVKELTGCNNEIIVRDYDLDIKLKKGMNVVEFTPDKTGTVQWSCWMGMIPGSFVVTDTGENVNSPVSPNPSEKFEDDGSASAEEVASSVASGGSCGGGADGGSCGSPTCGSTTGGGGCGCGG